MNKDDPISGELSEWLRTRDQALARRSKIGADGGHISLRKAIYDPIDLEEPLRSEALAYLATK